jgi:hypothetical protein
MNNADASHIGQMPATYAAPLGAGLRSAASMRAPGFDGPVAAAPPTIIEEIHRLQGEVIEGIQRATGRLHELHMRLIGPVPPTDEKGSIQHGRRFSEQGQLGQAYHATCSQRDSVLVLHQLIDLLNEI